MTANELRIGNYVRINNPNYLPIVTEKKTTLKVVGIAMNPKGCVINLNSLNVEEQIISPLYSQFLKYIFPIPLTEEILLKCGFENDENLRFRFFLDSDLVEITIDLDDSSIKFFDRWLEIKIKYLHQLQNLYFALTGEELKINN